VFPFNVSLVKSPPNIKFQMSSRTSCVRFNPHLFCSPETCCCVCTICTVYIYTYTCVCPYSHMYIGKEVYRYICSCTYVCIYVCLYPDIHT
jgi:hypothetical protein